MKLVSWNVSHGGGKRTGAIVETLMRLSPDVIALQEFRTSSIPAILEPLRDAGWKYKASTTSQPATNGICVLSRFGLRTTNPPLDCPAPRRWLCFESEGSRGSFAILHIPAAGKKSCKKEFWDCILQYARANLETPFLFAGSFNTGIPLVDETSRSFVCAKQFRELSEIGFTDLWRKFHGDVREYTWFSNYGNGFRLDHAFASPGMTERAVRCEYIHEPRTEGTSYHSLVLLETAP